ncbi:MAG: serine hydrolase [Alphaproteobacteria bacterium]|nr:serine hydrolase [Alphaproteobacteria bacterium]
MTKIMLTVAACMSAGMMLFNGPVSAASTLDGDALTQTLEAKRVEDGIVGFAVGVIDDGYLVYSAGFGEKTLGSGEPITPNSIFHWASVSKPFVATAIMQLYERGKIDLDDKLVDILPDYEVVDPRTKAITIRQILSHTAGLPDVENYNWDKPEFDDFALSRWALKQSPRELLFTPGTERKYSNLGFEILGVVIERVSGKTFEQYMQDNIFSPLNMTNSTFYYPDTPEHLRVTGHAGEPNEKHKIAHYPYNRRHAPSSTLNTNIEEIARFAQALLKGGELDSARILQADTIKKMWAPHWKNNEDGSNANTLGWSLVVRNGQTIINHSGWDDGFRSALVLLPGTNQAILFVTNDEQARPGKFIGLILGQLSKKDGE